MLILSRREGDAILLDGGIRIVVLACDRRGVRIGIEAPPEVSIVRGEIVAQVEAATRQATASPAAAALLGAPVSSSTPAVPPTSPAAPAPAPAPGAR
ncbi:MAG: carbon storage regulator [Gemmatimonadaceae bacterium]|jgi:carbon storage regulator|nr:carbon storage regulator [Gemmatimonadaceae bacterium]